MGLLSSIATKLKVPVVLQVLLLVVVGFFYLSSQNEVRSRREQAKEMGMIVGRLQSLGVDIQLLLHGQGDLQKVEAELGAQSAQIKKLPFGGRLASLRESKRFCRIRQSCSGATLTSRRRSSS
ncbi:hypothetical protein [Geotalea toluenoxydans]|uniref:hypothetical protein n=1 Tax=Geotalea toluenoxydans TaxID=421624 RepID=UPI001FB1AF36|nr:hypothetical protein [Geotalea toluenoxydans]